jgi:hypothetical protein
MRIFIICVISFFGGYFLREYFTDMSKRQSYEPKESMVINSFKLGCELAILKNDLTDKKICKDYLIKNKDILEKLISRQKN